MSRESDNGFVCGDCGETVYRDLCACDVEPIEDALGQDPLQKLLEDGFRMQQRLRASRDTAAIRASNKNFEMFLRAIGDHI